MGIIWRLPPSYGSRPVCMRYYGKEPERRSREYNRAEAIERRRQTALVFARKCKKNKGGKVHRRPDNGLLDVIRRRGKYEKM